MEFGNHLKNLLYLHDCIIIPGLGGFVARYYPAKIDSLRRKIKPPTKEFSFDDSLVNDHNLLVDFIARMRGIESFEARAIVERFSSQTKAIVLQGDRAELPGLGWFHKGAMGRILFDFEIPNNFHPETAGLPEMNLPEFHKGEKKTDPMQKPLLDEPERTPKSKKTMRRALVAGIILILLILAGWGSFQGDKLREVPFIKNLISRMESQEEDVQPDVVSADVDSLNPVGQSLDTLNTIKNALNLNTPSQKQKTSGLDAGTYYIIAGSFRKDINAQELSSELTLVGYKTEILTSNDGWYRVSVMNFNNKNQALQALRKVKADGKIPSAWLKKIE